MIKRNYVHNAILEITGIEPKYLSALHQLYKQKGGNAKAHLEELLDIQ